jgi:hypothetical protein
MRRRYVLLTGLAGLTGILGVRFAFGSPESAIIKVISKQLGYLKLEPAGVRQFAQDLAARKLVSPTRLRIIDSAGPLYTANAMSAYNKLYDGIHHGEERVTTQYLMSSDFFKNGADESREVHYLGYYDPMTPCNNPFARRPLG